MKRFLLYLILFTFCSSNSVVNAQWVSSYGGFVAVEALASSGTNIFAATHNNGIYLSTNNGADWAAASTGLPVASITYTLAFNGDKIFAGTDGNWGVYTSTNNGTNWVQSGFSGIQLKTFLFNGSNMFAGTNGNGAVYLSTDSGINWTAVNSGMGFSPWVNAFAMMGTNLFAGGGSTLGNGVFMTTDNGINWTRPANTGIPNQSITTLSVIGTNLFAGASGAGMFLSTDNGENWTGINTGLTNSGVRASIVVGNNLFVGTYGGGVFLTTDNGANWSKQNTGLAYLYVTSFAISDGKLYAGHFGVSSRSLSEMVTSVEEYKDANLPVEFELSQNYPNPFNPSTTLSFAISHSSLVSLKVFDVLGKEIAILVNENKPAGNYEVNFDASKLSTGVYFYQLRAGTNVETKRMILIK